VQWPFLRAGQRVRVEHGPLRGVDDGGHYRTAAAQRGGVCDTKVEIHSRSEP